MRMLQLQTCCGGPVFPRPASTIGHVGFWRDAASDTPFPRKRPPFKRPAGMAAPTTLESMGACRVRPRLPKQAGSTYRRRA